MAKIKGKQIAIGIDGVDTDNLNDGALAASSDGRNKMASSFFDSTSTVSSKFDAATIPVDRLASSVTLANGSVAFTGDQSMGGFKLTSVGTPTAGTDGANKTYVDTSFTTNSPYSTTADKSKFVASDTSGNNANTGLQITYAPYGDGYVGVSVNGVLYEVGDGVTTKDCYFSSNGTAGGVRSFTTLVANDYLVWNGTVVGFDLLTTYRIDFFYEKL